MGKFPMDLAVCPDRKLHNDMGCLVWVENQPAYPVHTRACIYIFDIILATITVLLANCWLVGDSTVDNYAVEKVH